MLTVVAIDESLMREIGEFEPLLNNVAEKGDYKICGWKRHEKTLQKAIPALFDREFISEGELLEWNILIVSDNRNCFDNNPFDGNYSNDTNSSASDIKDAELNELAKMLGVIPVHSEITNKVINEEDGTFSWQLEVDKTLRDEKLLQYKVDDFTRPQRIYLVAVQKDYDVNISEFKAKSGVLSSYFPHFSEDGLYPPNCRFFKFNLSTKSNKITTSDYFRLWMTILSFAYNDDADDIFLAPDALYSIDCDVDEKVVSDQINEIYSRVHYVKRSANAKIEQIHQLREFNESKHYEVPLLDSEIVIKFETDEDGLYLDNKKFGLAKNCPVPDEQEYSAQRANIERNIKEYLKAPRRAIRRAVSTTKEQGVYEHKVDEFIYLNRDQTEDLDEIIDTTEIELLKLDAVDINYPKENALERKVADKRTNGIMKKRSTVGAIIGSSFAIFVAFIVSFLPYIFGRTVEQRSTESYEYSVLITLGCVLIMAICGFITLIILKSPLRSALFHFKKVIDTLVSYVKNQAVVYSHYLSKLSGFMKKNSFKRYLNSDVNEYLHDDELIFKINIDYCDKIESLCKEWANSLNFDLAYDESKADLNFEFDNTPHKNPIYSFVVSRGENNISFNKRASRLVAPYEFISSFNISREEVYECQD